MAQFLDRLSELRNGAKVDLGLLRKLFQALQAKFPVKKQDIAGVFASVIDWTGFVGTIPASAIPPINQLPGAQDVLQAINCLDVLRGVTMSGATNDELYFGPGHVLHRGLFKLHPCNEDGTIVRLNAASLLIPGECPPQAPGTSGLDKAKWYYGYAKLDVAGTAPEFRITEIAPVWCPGYGPEHPDHDKMRYLGCFRTEDTADAWIEEHWRGDNGWYFWREKRLGPWAPTTNVHPGPTGAGAWADVDLSKHVPPTADFVTLTAKGKENQYIFIRPKGDVATAPGDPLVDGSGFTITGNDDGDPDLELKVPINTINPGTDKPFSQTVVQVAANGGTNDNWIAVTGFHEPLL